ncbi:MAG: peptidylprolyl isomerase [Acidobacteriota bacterium]|nr:peptidylprolyl isomerase [Acidobacteriota bacterium]
MFRKRDLLAGMAIVLGCSLGLRAQNVPPPKGLVIEQIIARVNDDIITSNQYQDALNSLRQEIKQDCTGCTAAKLDSEYKDQQKDVLRDLIDQSLMVQRAKDEGINVDIDVVKQLDKIRQQYKLDSMDALQRAVEASGLNWDDYKDSIKNRLLTQKLIQRDVGGTIQIDHKEIEQYYQAHKSSFDRPETVVVREIFLSTKGKTPEQSAEIKKKIEGIRQRIENGDDFGQLAKLYSEGSTAQDGGELGSYTRGQMPKGMEDAVFTLQHNQMTPVLTVTGGFELIQVEQHYQAGVQPLDAVANEIENDIYIKKIGPALRDFLNHLREESYIVVKTGYVDSAAVAESPIEEVAPGSSDEKKGKKKKGEG